MHNPQFNDQRNSACDIETRLRMEEVDTRDHGLPDDSANLIQLLRDAQQWIAQAKKLYDIPGNWRIETADALAARPLGNAREEDEKCNPPAI